MCEVLCEVGGLGGQVPMGPLKPPVIAGGKASPTALQLLPVHVQ